MFEVYFILNTKTDKIYVGQSMVFNSRIKRHKCDLKYGKHHCDYLQRAWNLYGEECFQFFSVYSCDDQEEANEIEKFFINWFLELKLVYNPTWNHKGRGEVSKETREKLRICNLGKKASLETIEKLKIARKDANSKPFRVISPQGVIITGNNRTQFCRDHNLCAGNFNEVILGKRKHHKGWSLEGDVKAVDYYKLCNPNGNIVEKKLIVDFVNEFNLTRQCLYKLVKGKIKTYKGWTLKEIVYL